MEPEQEVVQIKDLNKWARRQAVLLRDDPEQWDNLKARRNFFAESLGYKDWNHIMKKGVEDLPRLNEVCWECGRPYKGES